MANPPTSSDLPTRTDDVARRIEYVTAGKWTDDQYKKVCSILRFYRHQSITAILDQVAGKNPESGEAMKK